MNTNKNLDLHSYERHSERREESLGPPMNDLEFHPISIDRWAELAAFFEHHGNLNYCWCMRWRLKSMEFKQLNSAKCRNKLLSLVQANIPIGILGYHQGKPAGWCSIALRETYALLEHSTTLKRIDNLPTWSVVCFFVDPGLRGQSLPVKLLQAAVTYAISQGAAIIEWYPVEPNQSYRFMGSPSVFEQAGFREVATAKNGRRIVRFFVDESR